MSESCTSRIQQLKDSDSSYELSGPLGTVGDLEAGSDSSHPSLEFHNTTMKSDEKIKTNFFFIIFLKFWKQFYILIRFDYCHKSFFKIRTYLFNSSTWKKRGKKHRGGVMQSSSRPQYQAETLSYYFLFNYPLQKLFPVQQDFVVD